MPLRAEKVLARIRETRGGKLYDPRFGKRQTGEGVYADQIEQLFEAAVRRAGMSVGCAAGMDIEPATTFVRPPKAGKQLRLF